MDRIEPALGLEPTNSFVFNPLSGTEHDSCLELVQGLWVTENCRR
jgi:hypothetical protein